MYCYLVLLLLGCNIAGLAKLGNGQEAFISKELIKKSELRKNLVIYMHGKTEVAMFYYGLKSSNVVTPMQDKYLTSSIEFMYDKNMEVCEIETVETNRVNFSHTKEVEESLNKRINSFLPRLIPPVKIEKGKLDGADSIVFNLAKCNGTFYFPFEKVPGMKPFYSSSEVVQQAKYITGTADDYGIDIQDVGDQTRVMIMIQSIDLDWYYVYFYVEKKYTKPDYPIGRRPIITVNIPIFWVDSVNSSPNILSTVPICGKTMEFQPFVWTSTGRIDAEGFLFAGIYSEKGNKLVKPDEKKMSYNAKPEFAPATGTLSPPRSSQPSQSSASSKIKADIVFDLDAPFTYNIIKYTDNPYVIAAGSIYDIEAAQSKFE